MNRTGASRSNPSGNPKGTIPIWIKIPIRIPNLNDVIELAKLQTNPTIQNPDIPYRNPYNQEKKRLQREIALIAKSQFRKTITELSRFTFYWIEPNKRRDPDNISAGEKFIFDALKEAGIIKNDGWRLVGAIEHRFGTTKKKPSVIIEITPYTRKEIDLGLYGKHEL